MKERITVKEKIGYSFTSFAVGCWNSFVGTFLLYFYTNVAGIRPALAGTIISLAVIWDAVNDPIFASLADNHKFKNGDKMRPFLLYASVPLALCLVLMFTVIGKGTTVAVMAFVTYFIFRIPSTLHTLPMNAMRQLVSPDDADRVSIGTWATGGGSVGVAIAAVAFWPLIRGVAGLDAEGQMIHPQRGFIAAAAAVGVLVIAASFYNYFTTKERVKVDAVNKVSILTACRLLFKNRDFDINLVLLFFYGMLSTLVSSYALYYCSYVLEKPGLVTAVSAMFILGSVAALPFVGKIYSKFGRKGSFAISSAVLTAGSLVLLLFSHKIFAPFVFCFAIGTGTELASVLLAVNKADITDLMEKQENFRMDGMVSNVSNFVQKCASAVLTFVLGLVLEFSHFDGNLDTQPESAVTAIVLIMGLGSLIASVGLKIGSAGMRIDDELKGK